MNRQPAIAIESLAKVYASEPGVNSTGGSTVRSNVRLAEKPIPTTIATRRADGLHPASPDRAARSGDEPHTIDPQSPERSHGMSNVKRDNDASVDGFMAGWSKAVREYVLPEGFAVIELTNFGERPVSSARLAEVLGRPMSEAETLARRIAWPPTRVENGLVSVYPERVLLAPRRRLQVGDRRFGVTGCAPDVFLYAPLVRPSLRVEETCPATGTPIAIVFTPSGVESVDPPSAVVPVPAPQEVDLVPGMGTNSCQADATLCAECPFYSSAEAAQGWLAAHPGGRVFPVREAWDLSVHQEWRDRMSALLNPDTLQVGRPGSTAN